MRGRRRMSSAKACPGLIGVDTGSPTRTCA